MSTARSPVRRAESQARTRAALVDVARRLFLTAGYAATTLDRVAVEAGFSKGAVYSNFRNKDELALAVLQDIDEQELADVVALFTGDRSFDDRLAAFERWAEVHLGDPDRAALEVEFATRARHSDFVATALAERNQRFRAALATVIADSAQRYGLAPAMPPEDLATALHALGQGLGLARATDASVRVAVMTQAIRTLLGARS